jgi:hypothetical protein
LIDYNNYLYYYLFQRWMQKAYDDNSSSSLKTKYILPTIRAEKREFKFSS